MKKVLEVIHGFSMGGAETLVKDYCLKINKEKFEVVVLCFQNHHSPYDQMLHDHGIRVIYLDEKVKINDNDHIVIQILKMLLLHIYVRKAIKEENPDIIHSHLQINSFIMIANPKKSVKLFHTNHTEPKVSWNNSPIGRIDYYSTKHLVKKYHMPIIVLHEKMRNEVNQLFKVNNSIVLNNGIDFNKFIIKTEPKNIREKLKIPSDAFIVGHVGRFSYPKNHTFLLEIFQEIVEKKPNSFLLLVGDGELKEQVQKQISEKRLQKQVIILSNRTDIPELMSIMDVFVFPSLFEGLAIVLIEAQKMKLKCFISDKIPAAAVVSNYVKTISLSTTAKDWAKSILSTSFDEINYNGIEKWDMNIIIHDLEKIYDSSY